MLTWPEDIYGWIDNPDYIAYFDGAKLFDREDELDDDWMSEDNVDGEEGFTEIFEGP
jgi:hypothetical protein